tara:strand:+ start:2126 stop:2287 length:162 start_codon:yes stop_codon:yes gene_type:complete
MTRLDDLSATELRWYCRSLGCDPQIEYNRDRLRSLIRTRRESLADTPKEGGTP